MILMLEGSTQEAALKVRLRFCCQVSLRAFRPSRSPGEFGNLPTVCTLGSEMTRSKSLKPGSERSVAAEP